jgi:hypothetical protein
MAKWKKKDKTRNAEVDKAALVYEKHMKEIEKKNK